MIVSEGFYAVAYVLGFNYLSCIIYYFTPMGLVSSIDEDENNEVSYDIPETLT
jgi:hypothetical protein